MPRYIHLITLTDAGHEHMPTGLSPNPVETARRFGGEILDDYLTLGRYDIVVLSSFPDDEAVAAFALAMASGGDSTTETMRAFDTDEFAAIRGTLVRATE